MRRLGLGDWAAWHLMDLPAVETIRVSERMVIIFSFE
jgi:hypothetical protein